MGKKEEIKKYIKKRKKLTISYKALAKLFNATKLTIIHILDSLANEGAIQIQKNNIEGANIPNTYIYKEG